MSHHWLYRHSKEGQCPVCQVQDEVLVPNGNGHYVCMDAEGCYARWKALDLAGINAEPAFVDPYPPRRKTRRKR
ncbi:MAG: hypothetical protein ACJ780_31515 [Solirubrobacteraceae bacterium]